AVCRSELCTGPGQLAHTSVGAARPDLTNMEFDLPVPLWFDTLACGRTCHTCQCDKKPELKRVLPNKKDWDFGDVDQIRQSFYQGESGQRLQIPLEGDSKLGLERAVSGLRRELTEVVLETAECRSVC